MSLEELNEALVREAPIEVRLRGLKAEDRLHGLTRAEKARLWRLLDQELAAAPHAAKGRRPRRK